MSAGSSGPTIRCSRTINMCRSAITAGQARSAPSGEPVIRPNGQRKPPDADVPDYGPSRRLDYELELGLWIGRGNELGQPIPIGEAERPYRRLLPAQRLVGARPPGVGISAAGAVPGQEFPQQRVAVGGERARRWRRSASRCRRGRKGDPAPLPYLDDADDRASGALAIQLEVTLTTEKMRAAGLAPHVLSRGSADAAMYWSAAQIVTHHSANGCNLQPGDLIGTGTLSTDSDDRARLADGDQPRAARRRSSLASGETRSFLEDGDEIDAARLVRSRRRGADRLRRMRRPGGSGALGLAIPSAHCPRSCG